MEKSLSTEEASVSVSNRRIIVGCLPIVKDKKLIERIKCKSDAPDDDDLKENAGWMEVEPESHGQNLKLESSPMYVLLVTSKAHPKTLIIPKGGLHHGESACCGAIRETWEESGVSGTCGKLINDDTAEKEGEYWFALHVKNVYDQWPEKHQRKRVLVNVNQVNDLDKIRPAVKEVINKWLSNLK